MTSLQRHPTQLLSSKKHKCGIFLKLIIQKRAAPSLLQPTSICMDTWGRLSPTAVRWCWREVGEIAILVVSSASPVGANRSVFQALNAGFCWCEASVDCHEELFHFHQWFLVMRTSTLPVNCFDGPWRHSWAKTVALYLEPKPLSHRTRSTWCLLSIFHTSTRKHFQNSRATHIKPCRDCVIWLCVSGRADGVISPIMEAVLSVEKPAWQPDVSACSSLESCSHAHTHAKNPPNIW